MIIHAICKWAGAAAQHTHSLQLIFVSRETFSILLVLALLCSSFDLPDQNQWHSVWFGRAKFNNRIYRNVRMEIWHWLLFNVIFKHTGDTLGCRAMNVRDANVAASIAANRKLMGIYMNRTLTFARKIIARAILTQRRPADLLTSNVNFGAFFTFSTDVPNSRRFICLRAVNSMV